MWTQENAEFLYTFTNYLLSFVVLYLNAEVGGLSMRLKIKQRKDQNKNNEKQTENNNNKNSNIIDKLGFEP